MPESARSKSPRASSSSSLSHAPCCMRAPTPSCAASASASSTSKPIRRAGSAGSGNSNGAPPCASAPQTSTPRARICSSVSACAARRDDPDRCRDDADTPCGLALPLRAPGRSNILAKTHGRIVHEDPAQRPWVRWRSGSPRCSSVGTVAISHAKEESFSALVKRLQRREAEVREAAPGAARGALRPRQPPRAGRDDGEGQGRCRRACA